jgi:tryptophan-rich sensory protein
MPLWYEQLNRPPLTPPDWVFSPVWTVLYVMIIVSIVLYYRSKNKTHVAVTTGVLIVHVATNLIWTYFFFGLQSPL